MADASVVSVNVGRVETIGEGRRRTSTGICKRPAEGPVFVGTGGLAGDSIVSTRHHGGPDQAVYVYSQDDYDWWHEQTGRDYGPGLFGENLTILGLPAAMRVGDRLRIGAVLLEATAPRIPCDTFATRIGDPGFGLAFRHAERPGVYFRVLGEGEVRAGDVVDVLPTADHEVSVVELFRFKYALRHDAEDLRRFLAAPLAIRFRADVERALAGIDSGSA